MQRRNTAALLLVLLGTAGCSSGPPALRLPSGALPGGTAEVTVNGNDTGRIHRVECESIGKGLARISIGSAETRTTVLVSGDTTTPKGVSFSDVQGFTGSYWQDLQGSARLAMIDQTYTLTGTAAGFSAGQPYTRTMNDFSVKVAC
jgi:ipoprotein LpqH